MKSGDVALMAAGLIGAFMLGRFVTLKQQAQQAQAITQAQDVDPTTAWFMQFGGLR